MTLFSALWSCFTLSTWWCQRRAVQWVIPNTDTENKQGLYDAHVHGAWVQVGSERRVLETSLSIPQLGAGVQRGLPWPPANDGSWVTWPHRTVSFIDISVSNFTFLCVTIWLKSVSLLMIRSRRAKTLIHLSHYCLSGYLTHGKRSIIICGLNDTAPFHSFPPLGLLKVSWMQASVAQWLEHQKGCRLNPQPLLRCKATNQCVSLPPSLPL